MYRRPLLLFISDRWNFFVTGWETEKRVCKTFFGAAPLSRGAKCSHFGKDANLLIPSSITHAPLSPSMEAIEFGSTMQFIGKVLSLAIQQSNTTTPQSTYLLPPHHM